MTTQLSFTEQTLLSTVFTYLIINAFLSGWFLGSEYKKPTTPMEKAKIFMGCFIAFFFGIIIVLIWVLWSIFDLVFNNGNSLAEDPDDQDEPDEDGPFTSSLVKCDLCGYKWRAVRPKGTPKLQCPTCQNITFFENVE